MKKVLRRVAQLAQRLKPELGVLLLVFSGGQEEGGNLLEPLFLGHRGEVGVFVPGLGFPCKRFPQILFGLGTGVGVFLSRSGSSGSFSKTSGGLLADRADEIRGKRSLVNVAADCAFPFFHRCILL